MRKAKIYRIKSAGMYDGETVVAYTFADALRCAQKHVGTQRGGVRTTVRLTGICTSASDFAAAYLDAR
jgi:hypothetical protein